MDGCIARFDRFSKFSDYRNTMNKHYCGVCQGLYCQNHTAFSPHTFGSCGVNSKCLCIRCYENLSDDVKERLKPKNKIAMKDQATARQRWQWSAEKLALATNEGQIENIEAVADADTKTGKQRWKWGIKRVSTQMKVINNFKNASGNNEADQAVDTSKKGKNRWRWGIKRVSTQMKVINNFKNASGIPPLPPKASSSSSPGPSGFHNRVNSSTTD